MVNSKSKKVLILAARDPAFDGRLFHLEAKALAKAGYDVTLGVYRSKNEAAEFEVDGIKIITFKKINIPILRKFHTLYSLMKIAMKTPADIIQVMEADAPLFAGAWAKKRLAKAGKSVKLVFESPEVWSFFYSAKMKSHFLRRIMTHAVVEYEHHMVRKHVDGITTAHVLEENYYLWQNPWTPVRCVIGGPPMEEWSPPKKRRGKINIIGHDGYFTLNRGMDIMLGAFEILAKEFPKLKFLSAGVFMYPEDENWFDKWCERTGLRDRVEYAGWVNRDNILEYLDRMDIGLIANRPDLHSVRCWPANKVMFYMARELPIVSTPTPLYRKNIEKIGCGAVGINFSAEAMADVLRPMIQDSDATRKMGKLGYETAYNEYRSELGEEQLLKLYEDIYKDFPKAIENITLI